MIERYNPSRRYRERARNKVYLFIFFVFIFLLSGCFGFWIGVQNISAHYNSMMERNNSLEREMDTLRAELTAALTQQQEANMRYADLQKDMNQIVPEQGPLRNLLELVRTRLDEGTSPERMAFVIRAAQPPRNCKDPETKRLIVSTPTYEGRDSQISIEGRKIKITASGAAAKNDAGDLEAWYDQGREVEVVFEKDNGEIINKKGTLPLKASMVAGGKRIPL